MEQSIAEFGKTLHIDHKFSVPYHHESLGSIERNHEFLINISEVSQKKLLGGKSSTLHILLTLQRIVVLWINSHLLN